ncbi:AfsR/SARP family transcriptional regulator [Nesterenkonia xinjiangensis]|uniref:Putative ATPase/DNA-binding SARP family transcriptional activator n=1 Tax=Nesterenkonia xinjiangensis TaxID=225327 RepID=A0A7Z0GM45_9MICC|nr:BTAD domain-containing putative transcriptional regulator [Nesterenkonia xinjiangensis]NYJ77686.1 putative ATPase/DNA-binding SARP family transcriptional activator [Nesterenkonia xinjiangensis]
MRIEVLGPIGLRASTGETVEVPERKVRALLAALTADLGDAVPSDTLIERVWGADLPAHPIRVLQAKLSQLRSVLDTAHPGGRALLSSGPGGHRLATCLDRTPHVEPSRHGPGTDAPDQEEAPPESSEIRLEVDAEHLRTLLSAARDHDDPAERAPLLREALGLWRGEPYAELRDAAWLAPTIQQLRELRLDATEMLGAVLLDRHEPQQASEVLLPAFAQNPLRAELCRLLMLALHRARRQPDALGVFSRHHRHLVEELGADPDQDTAALHIRILQQDPSLHSPGSVQAGSASDLRPSDAPTAHARRVLPTFASSFLGRSQELREVDRRLQQGPLTTILGVGGVGKTRLAVRAAERFIEHSGHPARFIDLTSLDPEPPAMEEPPGDPALGDNRVARAIAEGMGLTVPRREAPGLLSQLVTALQASPGLLVLDNCEHVVGQTAAVAEALLADGASLRILATSREPLGLPGEQRIPLDPLPMAGTVESAVEFFLTRAREVRPDLPDDPAVRASAAELCRRLDGLPLALELAAAQTGALDLDTLLARINDRLDLLRRPGRGAPRRQQTLRGMLDWSWSLLDEPEQILLRRLAVHPVSWTLETIESICADAPGDPLRCGQVMPTLISLVERSLVVAEDGDHGRRYHLLESVSAYAAEKLHESGEREHLALIHLRHWRDEVACAQEHLFSAHARDWVVRLQQERTHIIHAFDEAVEQERGDDAVGLANSWFWHRWMTGAVVGLGAELRRATDCPGPRDAAHAQVQLLAEITDARRPDLHGRILRALDEFCSLEGGGPPFQPAAEVRLARMQVQWFAATAFLASRKRRPLGRRLADEAVEHLVDAGDLRGAAFASTQRDWFLLDAGEAAVGMPGHHDAEQILRAHGDAYGLIQILGMKHLQAERDDDRGASAAAAQEAAALARELGALGEESYWETVRGLHALTDADPSAARAHLQRAQMLSLHCGFGAEAAFAELALAELADHEGDAAQAARHRSKVSSRAPERWVRRVLEATTPDVRPSDRQRPLSP